MPNSAAGVGLAVLLMAAAAAADPLEPAPDGRPGPSFDCTKARRSSDRLICTDRDLSLIDLALSDLYRELDLQQPEAWSFRLNQDHRDWLRRRDQMCGLRGNQAVPPARRTEIASCLKAEYGKRYDEVRAGRGSPAVHPPRSGHGD